MNLQMAERFGQLPGPAKAVTVVAGGGGLAGAAYYVLSPRAMYVVAIGIFLIALLMLGYKWVLAKLGKRKANPMLAAISGNAAGAPQGIADPARRAALDGLRKVFENGVEKFKTAGKNIYALPWYALVGEPGSGKTEAIRHCNVGFPPGLQDELQGVGGTINMNWWFTNHAVILDTAGRLMFEEVEPGSTNEWQEFLKLLRRHRPNCPINGMMLVIPAESLIKDTADQLEKKGGKIARQLDSIQRILGVRFPVFVVITKCDLINGFREFFDTLKDPQLQHQMLGWSNPAELDQPFQPELVEQHLKTVQQRLSRRRLGLLIDPVNTDDPSARRADQVDALYAFPEALVKIAPRLRRYLEMIFVAGEWSAKPLFLRGIYFTSSMREGSALDADLAEALGRPIESLPEGRIWERDRAYFLRDLFMQKVFKEKGLVTRASNTKQQQRQRQTAVLATAAAGLIAVSLFTWLGWRGLKREIIAPTNFWAQTTKVFTDTASPAYANRAPDYYFPIIYRDAENRYHYRDASDDTLKAIAGLEPLRQAAGQFPLTLADQATKRIGVPWVFYPVAAVTGDSSGNLRADERRDAARLIFEGSVLRPALDLARDRMAAELKAGTWSAGADEALTQLLRVEVGALKNNGRPRPLEPTGLFGYALGGRPDAAPDVEAASRDAAAIQEACAALYGAGSSDWALRLAAPNTAMITDAVRVYAATWSSSSVGADGLGQLVSMAEAIRKFGEAERALQGADNQPGGAAEAAIRVWNEQMPVLTAQAEIIRAGLPALGPRTLEVAYQEELAKKRDALKKGLLGELAPIAPGEGGRAAAVSPAADAGDRARHGVLDQARLELEKLLIDSEAQKAIQAKLAEYEAQHLGGGGLKPRLFEARLAMYRLADDQLKGTGVEPKFGGLRRAMDGLNASARAAAEQIDRQVEEVSGTSAFVEATNKLRKDGMDVSKFMLQLAGRERRGRMIGDFLAREPSPDLARAAELVVSEGSLKNPRPRVPLTVGESMPEFDPRFHPVAAGAILGDVSAIAEALSSEGAEERVLNAGELAPRFAPVRAAAQQYAEAYTRYWTEQRLADLELADRPWAELNGALQPFNQITEFAKGLDEQARAIETALTAVAPYGKALGVRIDAGAVLAQELAAAKATLQSPRYNETYQKVLRNWRGLEADVGIARDKLRQAVGDQSFDSLYVPERAPESGLLGDFVARFWEHLSLDCLAAVAAGAQTEAIAARDRIRADPRFPVVVPPANKPQLTPREVSEAARGLANLLPAEAQANVKLEIGRPRFDEQIARLFGRGVITDADKAWFRQVRAVLQGLPDKEGESLRCKVTRLAIKEKSVADGFANERYRYMGLVQGDGKPAATARLSGPDEELGQVVYPGGPLRLGFFKDQADPEPTTLIAVDQWWAPLRMLHESHLGAPLAERTTERTWVVEVLVDDWANPGKKLSLWLRLEFARELPTLDQWPR